MGWALALALSLNSLDGACTQVSLLGFSLSSFHLPAKHPSTPSLLL